MTRHIARKIRMEVELFLRKLDPTEFVNESINWGDLHVVGVYKIKDIISDSEHIRIEISEANSWVLGNVVSNFLKQSGYGNIEVVTDW